MDESCLKIPEYSTFSKTIDKRLSFSDRHPGRSTSAEEATPCSVRRRRRIGKAQIVTGNRRQRNREIEIEIERETVTRREILAKRSEKERHEDHLFRSQVGRRQEIGKNSICIVSVVERKREREKEKRKN
uniref:Uncharacterized protein n=1 Tax=Noccaea caerulescens TaxID=107243 RepID=A0A1J3GI53_NOCCA